MAEPEGRRETPSNSNPNSAASTPALGSSASPAPVFGLSFVQPPSASPTQRIGYSRVISGYAPPTIAEEEDITNDFHTQDSTGLGIAAAQQSPSPIIRHVRGPDDAPMWSPGIAVSPPGSSTPFQGEGAGAFHEPTPDLSRDRFSPYTGTYDEFKRGIQDELGVKPPWSAESFPDLHEDVKQSLARIENSPFVTKTTSLRGFIFDVATGKLDEVAA